MLGNHPCAASSCREIIPRGDRFCEDHSHLNPANQKKSDPRYHTKQWREVRKQVLLRDNYICTCGCNQPATEVDHIDPWKEGGGFFDMDNLQSLTKACHTRKTQKERRK